jgi:hypothetical protein
MKTAIALLLACAVLGLAQESKTGNVKRLVSVTWDLTTHKLICVVEKGTMVDGEFVPSSGLKYEVSPDDALMALGSEQRAFAEEEAASLHILLDLLSQYCVQSVVWWDHGEGTPPAPAPGTVTKPERPSQPIAPIGKPVKVAKQKFHQTSGTQLGAARDQ